jgi:hypothetical protein
MTTNQAIAMSFPLLTAGVVWLTGYFVKRSMAKAQAAEKQQIHQAMTASVDEQTVERVTQLLRRAERELHHQAS